MGPHTFNFAQAAELSLEAGASLRVADLREGVARACELAESAERAGYVERSLAFATAHRGAAVKMARRIATLLAAQVESEPSRAAAPA
jgi:3-deoxy-D-manno-octulosonic-acid transferase